MLDVLGCGMDVPEMVARCKRRVRIIVPPAESPATHILEASIFERAYLYPAEVSRN